jgi:hypothetical protein
MPEINGMGANFELKDTKLGLEGKEFWLKGTGFSPYIQPLISGRALAPEGQQANEAFPQGLKPGSVLSATTYGLKPVLFNTGSKCTLCKLTSRTKR